MNRRQLFAGAGAAALSSVVPAAEDTRPEWLRDPRWVEWKPGDLVYDQHYQLVGTVVSVSTRDYWSVCEPPVLRV